MAAYILQRYFSLTLAFIQSIKNISCQKINVSEQMDVDEFLASFFDQIEKELKA